MVLINIVSSHINHNDSCNSVMALVVASPSVFSPLIVIAICRWAIESTSATGTILLLQIEKKLSKWNQLVLLYAVVIS